MFKRSSIFRGLSCVFSMLLIVMIFAANILEKNRIMVDETFGTRSTVFVTEEGEDNLFTAFPPDEDFLTDGKLDPDKYVDLFNELHFQIQAEGSVLLKNTNNTLPITGTNKKITLLGRRSYEESIHTSLEKAGFEVNPAFGQGVYVGNTGLPRQMSPGAAKNKTYDFKYDPYEGSVEWLAQKVPNYLDEFEEYDDAAIITIGRNSAEGADYVPGDIGLREGVGARNAMALSKNERDIINLACENFDKVIVLIRSVPMMELGDLKDNPNVDAILWIGEPKDGRDAIGEIIAGKVSPSGGLYNLHPRNAESAPAMMNFGNYRFTNWMEFGEGIPNKENDPMPDGKNGGRVDTGSVDTRGTDPGLENYLIEAESIYIGYRYYETRYYDCVMGDPGAKSSVGAYDSTSGWNYTEEVAYGFGYGLSYTTFEKTIGTPTFTRKAHEVIATVPVTVKNTGNVASKTSVQLYVQSPYTNYDKLNLVEKSAIQLVAFEKTKLLEPGETQTINIRVDLQDFASYDYKNAKTYIMDVSDDYYFAVGNGAHDALNNILAAQGKTVADGMDYNGNPAGACRWSYNHPFDDTALVDSFTFSKSKAGVEITNQLPYSDYNYYDPGTVTYLTRQDWSGTYPVSYTDLTANEKLMDHFNGNYIPIKTEDSPDKDDVNDVTWNGNSDLRFGHMIGASFDDYRWEELLDNLTIEEAIQGTLQGGRGFADMPSIGFPGGRYSENGAGSPRWYNEDSPELQAPWSIPRPEGFPEGYGRRIDSQYPVVSVIASTFNPELSKEWGRLLGNAAIFSETFIIWQPGANLHRTGWNGRINLYYSEDPVLTGVHTMEMAIGALDKGGIVCAKHFAFNDQEMHRFGVGVFMTEQRARELELRAFQIAFEANKYDTEEKDVGMLGTMTAFNKIGGVECTTSEGLLTNILRKEWGYNGYCVSDLKDDLDLARQGIKAGMTGYDWRALEDDIYPWDDTEDWCYDKELMEAMKLAINRDLYMFANSSLMNRVNASTYTKWNMTWWRQAYIAGIVISSVLLLVSVSFYIVSVVLQNKKRGGILS